MIKIEQSTLDDFMATVNAHPEYSSEQMISVFGSLPPIMSDITAQSLGLTPENERTEPLRTILPKKIRHLITILDYNGNKFAS